MTSFDAWALPPDAAEPDRIEEVPAEAGDATLRHPVFEPGAVRELCRGLRRSGERILSRWEARRLGRALGRVGARFLEPGDPLRERALELLPRTAGLSRPMAREVLDGMARDWTVERIERLLRAEFGDPRLLDGFVSRAEGSRSRAFGPDLGFHVCAGTVPGVSATSLLRGLLVKSPTVVKPGRGDVVLPVLFARGVAEEAPDLATSVAVLYWPGGRGAMEEPFLREAGAVVVYGGVDTVRSVRERIPVTTPLVVYHHRLSVALVGRSALADDGRARRTAHAAARAVALFDQRGCVSPHAIFVERGGVAPESWAREVASALGELATSLPSGALLPGEASAIQQLRGTAELRAAAGREVRLHHGEEEPWTVLVEPPEEFRPSCLGRVVRVHPVEALSDALTELADVGRFLQTVAVDGASRRRETLAGELARLGALRVTTLERAPWPPAWWHHDGTGPLRALTRWVDLED